MQYISLEREAQKVSLESVKQPRIYQLPPCQGREVLNKAQNSPVCTYPATVEPIYFSSKQWGNVTVYSIRPHNIVEKANVIFYIHGAGWVFGNIHTHYKLVTELAHRTNSIVIFPEYSLSPEAKYPTAIEQCYAILNNLPDMTQRMGWNVNFHTLTVAGDSVGGNMATVMTLLSKARKGICIHKQLLFYPVTNACFDTESYCKFGEGYYLYRDGMKWFWDQYLPNQKTRKEITASPLMATCEQLKGLPPAMILNGEADVLRSEGEAYAIKLRNAGVDVTAIRYQAMIHDFVMLHSLNDTKACRAAMDSATCWINRKNNEVFSHD